MNRSSSLGGVGFGESRRSERKRYGFDRGADGDDSRGRRAVRRGDSDFLGGIDCRW